MSLDPYTSCPCGSGKKYKWCCAAYYPEVEKALALEQQSQHEAALAAMKELTKKHADKPAVWGYYAQFLYNSGQAEQAEEAVSEALKLNPNFGMAHFLRAQFRENEGELIGSLLLYRKAAEGYDPEAHDALTNVYIKVYGHEMMLNRPVAARAALERAVHLQPAATDLRQQFEDEFGDDGSLPLAARKKYVFRPTAKPVFAELATGKFGDARKAFEQLTALTPDDPAAWFNLGVVLAWLGEQPKAVDALQKAMELDADDYRNEEVGSLIEVLRCGHGMEADADYVSHSAIMPIREPNAVMQLLQAWGKGGKLRSVRTDPERGIIMGLVVEELPSLLAVGSSTLARVSARFMLMNGVIRLSHPNRDSVAKVADEIRSAVQLAVEAPQASVTPISLGDVALEALAQPIQTSDLTATENKLRDHARNFFENIWIHRPLKSLAGNSPLDAVGSSNLRKRVFGVVKFVEDCFTAVAPRKQIGEQLVPIEVYHFDALRHKLGLEYVKADPPKVNVPAEASGGRESSEGAKAPEATPVAHAPGSPTKPAKRDISAMNAGELSGLDLATMSLDELEQAMRAAVKLDAKELAVAFAQAGVLKPFDASHPDRYPLYAVAFTGASVAGDIAKAIELTEQGEKYDAEHNGGARAVDYCLKRAQLYVKLKDADKAMTEFDSLIAKHPEEGKFYTTAAEEMLRLRSKARAQDFAERGLAKAKEQNNRDLEGHCQELIAAAKKVS